MSGRTRVVVVGHGMVGSRFVEELVQRAPDRFDVTVLGAEEYEPYNRVLLSEVVAGAADVASLTLPRTTLPGVTVRPGAVVTRIDRVARAVHVAARCTAPLDGDDMGPPRAEELAGQVPYDVLVLATGARARIPAIAGLDLPDRPEGLPAGAHALRTLDDAREIVAATVNARRAVVLGAGVLGLEAACGLARRGVEVTVLHGGGHLMDRQLDAEAADGVVHALGRLGVAHRTSAVTEEVVVDGGRVRAVRVRCVPADGGRGARGADTAGGDTAGADTAGADPAPVEELPTDLLVLTAGTVPETGLAADAGLEVRRGVVVDVLGRTTDPAVHAIGDCAEPPEGGTGLIAQGWDQARRLAARLAAQPADGDAGVADPEEPGPGAAPEAAHGTDLVRLKAHGLSVVTMGLDGAAARGRPGHRALRLSDPGAGRVVEVVVADGVLVGATCVGAGPLAADLTNAYTRRTPVPADPAQLLVKPARGAASGVAEPSPTLMPDRATVCRCNGVTKGEIVSCWRHGARTVEDVARTTRATTGCGGCTDAVCGIVDWLTRTDPEQAPDRVAAEDGEPVAPEPEPAHT